MPRWSAFFDGVPQLEMELAGEAAKLPIFYYDGTAQTAVFAARLGPLRRLLPDPRFVPARLAPGLGAVAVSCFEYRDTDIGPYNELAIAVILKDPQLAFNAPGRALLAGLRNRQLHAWVQHLPVTTEIARVGGVELYGYPKFIGSIEFERRQSRRRCRLAEGDEPILTLDGPLLPASGRAEMQLFSHLWMDRQPQSSEFKLNVLAGARTLRPGAARLQLDTRHPIAAELDRLLVSPRAIYYELLADFEGILYGPDRPSLPLIRRTDELIAAGASAIG
ncbi:MAG: acetoacetate decarboxylase family protein [Solirubrobacterales bacterium]